MSDELRFRLNAIKGSAQLREAIFRMVGVQKPIVWFDPVGVSPRLKPVKQPRASKLAERTVKRGRPPIPFKINPEIEHIKQVVADHFGINRSWMERHCNAWSVSHPRQVAMYLARKITGASLPNIGRHFNRDHTTVLFALRAVELSPKLLTDSTAIRLKIGDNALRNSQEDAIEHSVNNQEERLAA